MNKNREPLFHIVKRAQLPWYAAWGIRGGAIVLAVISYKAWKKAKAQQLEEAEAAAEEAFLAEQEEELDMAAVEEEMVQAVERWKAAKKQQDAEENEEC